jgi:LysM repeat protein
MKQLWVGVILLAVGIFAWQAGRIWIGQKTAQSPQTITTPSQTVANTTTVSEEAELDTTPQTHKVTAGESLHSIGLKYNIRWASIAALNGLSEEAEIIEGQELLLPITVSGHIIEVREVVNDSFATQNAQNDARFAGITWRLDPVEVTRQTAPSELGILHDTPLVVESIDNAEGTAVVVATIDNKLRRVFLNQPVTTGTGGVWFIIRTETYRWPN